MFMLDAAFHILGVVTTHQHHRKPLLAKLRPVPFNQHTFRTIRDADFLGNRGDSRHACLLDSSVMNTGAVWEQT